MGRVIAILTGVLVLAILAGGLTEAALAVGHQGRIVDDTLLRPAGLLVDKVKHPTPAASKAPSPTPSVSPVANATPEPTPTPAPPTPTPAPTPTSTPSGPVAATNAFVHMRQSASVYSPILQDLGAGTVVRILPGGDAQWQKAEYNGVIGFVFKQWLTY